MKQKKHRTSLALEEEIFEDAKRQANRERLDRSDILRRWIYNGRDSERKCTYCGGSGSVSDGGMTQQSYLITCSRCKGTGIEPQEANK